MEWLVVDDGSTDATVAAAREGGVDHIVSLPTQPGLGAGVHGGVGGVPARRGGHHRQHGRPITNTTRATSPALIAPVMDGRADMVVGARPIEQIAHFSPLKKALQRLGSRVVQLASNTRVPDAPSGFRAFSRSAAMQINVFSSYSYTLETIIQAGQKGMTVASVPVRVNADLRPSRLVRSIPQYLARSTVTIGRIFLIYRPLRFFLGVSALLFAPGFLIGVRFIYELTQRRGQGHVQSLILAAILLIASVLFFILGLLAELISVNRRLLEDLRTRAMEERTQAKG